MKPIYIVIEDFCDFGEVDTSIKGVFDNKEEAEEFCKIIGGWKPNSPTQSIRCYVFETYIGWKDD